MHIRMSEGCVKNIQVYTSSNELCVFSHFGFQSFQIFYRLHFWLFFPVLTSSGGISFRCLSQSLFFNRWRHVGQTDILSGISSFKENGFENSRAEYEVTYKVCFYGGPSWMIAKVHIGVCIGHSTSWVLYLVCD